MLNFAAFCDGASAGGASKFITSPAPFSALFSPEGCELPNTEIPCAPVGDFAFGDGSRLRAADCVGSCSLSCGLRRTPCVLCATSSCGVRGRREAGGEEARVREGEGTEALSSASKGASERGEASKGEGKGA